MPVKREEATGDWRKSHNDEPHVVYSFSVVQVIRSKRWKSLHPRYDWLWYCDQEVMDHTPYSHNVVPIDSHFFESLKRHLAGIWFAADADVKQAVTSWIHTAQWSCLHWDTSLGATVGQMLICQSSMYHVLVMCHVYSRVRIMFLGLECLLPFLFCKFLCIFLQPVSFRHSLEIWHCYHVCNFYHT